MCKKSRDIELFLFDIYVAILKIEDIRQEFEDADELLYDYRAWDSIIREFTIIGEASKHLINKKLLKDEYKIVVDFRNFIVHEYFGIDAQEVWDTVCNDLDDFKESILKLIKDIKSDKKTALIKAYIKDNDKYNFIVKGLKEV
jgi:uncharacterized protein with HEPN domain